MKRIILLVLLFITINTFGQSLSKTHIIYESTDQIVMSNGKQYQVLSETDFHKVSNQSIKKQKKVLGHVLSLHRVLVIKSNAELIKLVEWSKDHLKFYEYHEVLDHNLEENQTSSAALPAK